jgi:hypothetical protein
MSHAGQLLSKDQAVGAVINGVICPGAVCIGYPTTAGRSNT